MTKRLINKAVKIYLRARMRGIRRIRENGEHLQEQVFQQLLLAAFRTDWGRRYDFKSIRTVEDFQQRIPIQSYDSLKPYIQRMMMGERSVLWPGKVNYFSKSSGTTEDKSKFIPVSKHNLFKCHIKGSWDTTATFYDNYPDAQIFEKKSILIGGTAERYAPHPKTIIGDISSLMMMSMPQIGRTFAALDRKDFLIKDWEEKVSRIAEIGSQEPNIVMTGGVPTWLIPIFNQILERTGKDHMLEVWPHFQVYIHGGVNFSVYRDIFKRYFPSEEVRYQEIYNATEGYFALQDDLEDPSLLLLLNHGIFYEFIPLDELDESFPTSVPLADVEPGVNYALCISTNSGLWRYLVGDTITFTSKRPYKIKITGRTKLFINAFGEELMIGNAERALALTCQDLPVEVVDYSVAPVYLSETNRGRHEWLIEFTRPPADLDVFAQTLDKHLKTLNSDYEAKRAQDIALTLPLITPLPAGTIQKWYREKGKMGGQNKIPRLYHNRKIAEELITLIKEE